MSKKKMILREDQFAKNEDDIKNAKSTLSAWVEKNAFDVEKYEFKASNKFYEGDNPREVKSVPEMLNFIRKHKECEVEATVLGFNGNDMKRFKMNRESFTNTIKNNRKRTFREGGYDGFNDGGNENSSVSGLIGEDFVPTLGGPFSKNLMYSSGWLQQAMAAFFASNHDPIAKAVIGITRDFVLGRGYRIDCKDKNALAAWRAFETVNNLDQLIDDVVKESQIYGEIMIQWLPNNEISYYYGVGEKDKRKGIIPRITLADPTCCWEIITRPEAPNDETARLAYVFIYPTQYQIFSTGSQPTSKFIYTQIPAKEIMHFRLNSTSNEKRGRSDLFSVLGYCKRIRDSINYGLIRELKTAAWCYDTTIEGSQQDLNSYLAASEELGAIPNAGGEFVHSAKIKRELLSAPSSGNIDSNTFQTTLSMVAIGSRIPTSYFGTHVQGGSTRAGAITATEPVAKFFESRQVWVERVLKAIGKRFFEEMGILTEDGEIPEVEVSFPEITTQDRSAKLKDLSLAIEEKHISRKRAAEIAAKEFGITDYDYEIEQEQIRKEEQELGPIVDAVNPLTGTINKQDNAPKSAITSDEKKGIKDNEYSA